MGRFLACLNEEEYGQIKLGDEGQEIRFFTPEEILTINLSPNLRFALDRMQPFLKGMADGSLRPHSEELGLRQ